MIGTKKQVVDWLANQSETQQFEIKKRYKKRSLNANAYAWALISKIADELRTSKDEVYLQMLEDYGQSIIVPVHQGLDIDGIFKYYRLIKSQPLNGQSADFYKIMKGSSAFDTREMSIFIDGIVSEAKQLDIEMLPADELQQLKDDWHGKKEEEQSKAPKEEEEKE